LIGIAPFYVDGGGLLGARRLRLCSDDLYPDGLDVIAQEGREADVVRRVWEHAAGLRGRWDVLVLDHLPTDAILLRHSALIGGRSRALTESATCPYLSIKGSFDAYFQTRPRLSDFSLTRKYKRLGNMGVVHRIVDDEAALSKGMDALFLLHEKRYKEKGEDTAFITDQVKEFHHRVARLFLKEGLLNLQLLYNGEEAVAAKYAFTYRNKVYFFQGGFDPAWGRLSVGMILIFLMIRQAFEQGLDEFDFLKGGEGYKGFWSDDVRREMRLTVYSTSLRGSLLHGAVRTREALGGLKRALRSYHSAWSPARDSLK
jgi:CelD/BcsL family acetyltransferase involved in cellulose biosynthesis